LRLSNNAAAHIPVKKKQRFTTDSVNWQILPKSN